MCSTARSSLPLTCFAKSDSNNARINFVKYSSYEGTSSTGKVKEIMGLTEDIEGMDVVIVEGYRGHRADSIHDGIGPEKTQPSVDTLRNAASQAGKFENRLRSRLMWRSPFRRNSLQDTALISTGRCATSKDIYVIDEEWTLPGGNLFGNVAKHTINKKK